jgi:S1-C subfamily serine protease
VAIADQIESGVTSSTIVQGVPGFLGVGVADATPGTGSGTAGGSTSGGAPISSVLQGGPADKAGITAGSVITKVGGKNITSGTQLRTVMDGVKPGSTVKVTWTGTDGSSHSAKITPIEGPAA